MPGKKKYSALKKMKQKESKDFKSLNNNNYYNNFINNIYIISANYNKRARELFNTSSGMKGIYVVGIYGYKNCSFELSFVNNHYKIIDLYSGVSHEKQLNAGD